VKSTPRRRLLSILALCLILGVTGSVSAQADVAPVHSGTDAATLARIHTPPSHNSAEPVTSGSAVLEQQRHVLAKQDGVAPSAVRCWDGISIWSYGNGRFVSTEVGYGGGYNGMLRARATVVDAWERYGVCRDSSTGLTYFWSDENGRLVSAELGYGGIDYGMLRARATVGDTWEQYYTSAEPGEGYTYFYAYGNGRYVSAELGYDGDRYGMLRARATAVSSWEWFSW